MLQLLSFVGLVAFALVGAVGFRIQKLARTTGGAPERWVAICLLAICGVAYPLLIASAVVPAGAVRIAAVSLGIAFAHVGIAAGILFTWSAFRPEVRWLRWPIGLGFAAMFAHWVGITTVLWGMRAGASSIADASIWWSLFTSATSGIGFGWTGVEALRFWSLLRRRQALGLADALVVNRVLLWGLVGVSSTLINIHGVFAILRGVNQVTDPSSALMTAVFGCFNGVALYLAFLPPASYVRWVRGGGEPAATAAR
jgi:hypothetical protein